jgi:gluconokinase
MSHILALDVGTSSVRAAVYDTGANVLPETVVKIDRTVNFTDDGGAELDAETAFEQVCEAIDQVFEKFDGEVSRVAMSCFWHSLVGIDSNSAPTTPVYTWAETRPAKYVQQLRDSLDEAAIHNRTGAQFHSSFWTAKLLWLRNESPDVFRTTKRWLSFSDYLTLKLSGLIKTSISMASGSGLLDLRKSCWDPELLEFLGVDEAQMPEIATDSFSFNSSNWEQLRNAKWLSAIGDGAANNIGAGCVERSKAALMIGTSGAMRVAFEGDVPAQIPRGLWCYRIDNRRLIVGGALSDGGGLYRWLKDTLKIAEVDDEVEAAIAEREPDSHGLTFLPFLAGERSTGYHENAKGAIIGLTQNTSSVEITQAAMESVAYRFANIVERLEQFTKLETIIASGGALRESPVWTQIIADILGKNLSLPDTREASSRGVVLLALENSGHIPDLTKTETPEGKEFHFNSEKHLIYKTARKRHEHFYQKLIAAENSEQR